MDVLPKTYHWDFFGPHSERTATHFLKHLRDFLERNEVSGCTVDVWSAGEGHHGARCVAPESAQGVIERSLRPNRVE